jgi:hypothetical protein
LGPEQFYARPIDWFAFREIVMHEECHFLETLFQAAAPQIVLDLGANRGLFSAYALSVAGGQSLFRRSQPGRLQRANEDRGGEFPVPLQGHQYAVWGSEGEIAFEADGLSTGRRVAERGSKSVVTVPAVTRASLLGKTPASSSQGITGDYGY